MPVPIPSRSVAAGGSSIYRKVEAKNKRTLVVASLWVGIGESGVRETLIKQLGGGGGGCDAAKERKGGA